MIVKFSKWFLILIKVINAAWIVKINFASFKFTDRSILINEM